MANTLRFKRGLASGLPTGLAGEPLFTTDTFDLYIGNGTGNTRFQKFIASGTTSQLLRGDGSLLTMPIVLSSPANGEVLKYNGTNWVNSNDAGITGSGTTNFLPKFTGASTLGNSLIYDDGTTIGIGTTSVNSNEKLRIQGGRLNVLGNSEVYQLKLSYNSATSGFWFGSPSANALAFYNDAGTERARFDSSGNFGIGITPTQRLDVSGYIRATSGFVGNSGLQLWADNSSIAAGARLTTGGNFIINNPSTDNGLRFQVTGDGYFSETLRVGFASSGYRIVSARAAGGTQIAITTAQSAGSVASPLNMDLDFLGYNDLIRARIRSVDQSSNTNGSYLSFFTNSSANTLNEHMRLDASGNLGLGVTPSAWGGGFRAIQVTANSFLASDGSVSNLGFNYFFNGTNPIYISSTNASLYQQTAGQHRWFNAPSGTAGNAITFTQAMTLDASGRLGIGTTSPTERLVVRSIGNSYANSAAISIENNTGANKTYITNANGVLYITNNTASDHLALYTTGNLVLSGTSDTGERFQVNGTMRVSGASTFGGAVLIDTLVNANQGNLVIKSTNNDASGLSFIVRSSSIDTNSRSWMIHSNYTAAGNFEILSSTSQFGNPTTARLTIDRTGAATFSSSVTATNLALDTTSANGSGRISLLSGGTRFGYIGTSLWALGEAGTDMTIVSVGGLRFATNDSSPTKLMLTTGGNLLIGTTTDAGYKLDVNGTMRVSGVATFATTSNTARIQLASNTTYSGILDYSAVTGLWYFNNQTAAASSATDYFQFQADGAAILTLKKSGAATFSSSVKTTRYLLTPSGTTQLYNIVDSDNTYAGSYVFQAGGGSAGYGGSIIAYGHSHASKPGWISAGISANSGGKFSVNQHGIGTGLDVFTVDANGAGVFSSSVTANSAIKSTTAFGGTFTASDGTDEVRFGSYYNTIGTGNSYDGVISVGKSTGKFIFRLNGSDRATFDPSGNLGIGMTPSYKLDVTGSARISDAIAIGTTPDTNLPFKILKNINSTVGIRFENTSTGASSFTGYQFGTDVSGGTAFTNFLYASSGVTETGVYKPNGTALINTGSGGLNFLAVSQPIRFFTSTGNGTLRAEIANDGFINHYTGTAPSTNLTDGYRQYSADITAGNAAPHFRTENGGIIKLYQQTTGVTSATYIGGAGTGLTDSDTFDGYTIAQIVKALRNAGLLA